MTIVEFRAGRLEIATFAERPELRAGVIGAESNPLCLAAPISSTRSKSPSGAAERSVYHRTDNQREDGVSAKPAVNAMRLACHLRGDRE